jgi:AbiTii
MPIAPLAFPEILRDGELFTFAFYQPVAAYEEILRIDPGDFRVPWPADALVALRPTVADMACVTAWQVVARGQVVGVVDGVRNRLLEFVLELEQEAPDAGEAPLSELPVSADRITQIFATTIYAGTTMTDHSVHVQGTIGNIVGGQGNTTRQGDALITQQTTDLAPLLERLRAAVDELPAGEGETTRGLIHALDKEAAAEQPRRERMLDLLKGVGALASTAGSAGAAVIDAVQAVHRALGG